MTKDHRGAFLAAALGGMTGAVRHMELEGVEVRRLVPATPACLARPPVVMPPPATPPASVQVEVQRRAAAAVTREAEALRQSFMAASPEARRIFLASLADVNF